MDNIQISDPKQVLLTSIANACGLREYVETIDNLHKVNVSSDVNYRKNYVGYYRVRRDNKWLDEYFNYFELIKENKQFSFYDIVRHISNVPHNVKGGIACTVEVSFASKMLTTIQPEYPIWDSQVVRALGIDTSLSGQNSHEEKIRFYATLYDELKEKLDLFLTTDSAQKCIAEFDLMFPSYRKVSKAKKIDFYLWNLGK